MSEEKTLAFVRELERADEAVSLVLAELDELSDAVEHVRAHALELEESVVRLPVERERLANELADAQGLVSEARDAQLDAERELAAAKSSRDEERVRAASRLEVRARDALRMAERRVEALKREQAALEARAAEAEVEIPLLDGRARELGVALAARPRLAADAGKPPVGGLAGIAEWGSRARAALLVARGVVAAEREGLIRQANELGSLVLGEPVSASSAGAIARRIERSDLP